MIDINVSKIVSEIGEPTARFIENEESKKQRKNIVIFSIVFLAIFIIAPILFLIFSQIAKANASQVSNKIKILTDDNKQMLAIETLGREIEKRNNSISAILKNNPNWSFVFDKLEKVIPAGITFSRFEAESPVAMKIGGLSPDYPTLSLLVAAMQQMKDDSGKNIFADVTLINASLVTVETSRYVDFIISFGVAKKINRESLYPENPVVETPATPTVTPKEETPSTTETPMENTVPETITSVPAPTPVPTDGNSLPTL